MNKTKKLVDSLLTEGSFQSKVDALDRAMSALMKACRDLESDPDMVSTGDDKSFRKLITNRANDLLKVVHDYWTKKR